MHYTDLIAAFILRVFWKCKRWLLIYLPKKPLLEGPYPEPGISYPTSLNPGNPARGEAWLNGDYSLRGAIVNAPGNNPFYLRPPNEEWAMSLQSFAWLQHIIALNTPKTNMIAVQAIQDWVTYTSLSNRLAWRSEIIARRLMVWSQALPFLMPFMTTIDRAKVLTSMGTQARYLEHMVECTLPGYARIVSACGLTYSAFAITGGSGRLQTGIRILCRELKKQILQDGGHISREPKHLAQLLMDLTAIRLAMQQRHIEVPQDINASCNLISSAIDFYCFPDGQFCVFNGSTQGEKSLIDAAKKLKPKNSKGFQYAIASGYQKLISGQSHIMMDVGKTPPATYSQNAHIAPLAFEFAHNTQRIFVNCGPNLVNGNEWREASRTPAAHNTLSFPSLSSNFFIKSDFSKKMLGTRLSTSNLKCVARRIEDSRGTWLEASHNLFAKLNGYSHHRRIYLMTDG
ncbi:MAG: heparinase II/III family protein, partial [Candidatus Micropelagos thuwalensis]